MNLLLVGTSHRTAPVEVRERFAVAESRIPEALRHLTSHPAIEEAVIVSTCNRVEFVLKVRENADGMEAVREFARNYSGLSLDEFAHCFYTLRDYEAARHLFRVASGLDSMVLGEPQVLGQVKRAYAAAREAGATGGFLDTLFSRVFNAAKRVRTETRVAEAPVSISSAAVELAERVVANLEGKTVMIIGAGQMGELAARHLVAKGASAILVSHRSYDHAVQLAEELRGTVIRFPEVWRAMEDADIVISATGCPHTLLRREDMEPVMAARGGRPLFLVDIAVPRDIDPAVGEIPGCTVANVDRLREAAGQNLRQREEALTAADRIIAEEVAQFRERLESLHVVPTIVSLRERAEQIRRQEMARMRQLFGEMTPEQERALDAVTQGLINKILHTPCTELKQAAVRPDGSEFLGVVRTVFQLEKGASPSPTLPN
jgi:glutamyl-tRNA reductase